MTTFSELVPEAKAPVGEVPWLWDEDQHDFYATNPITALWVSAVGEFALNVYWTGEGPPRSKEDTREFEFRICAMPVCAGLRLGLRLWPGPGLGLGLGPSAWPCRRAIFFVCMRFLLLRLPGSRGVGTPIACGQRPTLQVPQAQV